MKQFHIGITLALAIFLSSVPVLGQNIYRWTDQQGRIHYSNAPVTEAQSVDEELPPASNFGGAQNLFASPEESLPTTEQSSESSQPEEENSMSEENGMTSQDSGNGE